MHRLTKVIAGAAGLVLILSASDCSEESSQQVESENRQGGYDRMVEAQPGKTMDYSPTRETINFWVETWDEPGKLSYVYFQNMEGTVTGYYVLEGLPVSMCAAISPTYEIRSHSYGNLVVPAPANDGVYYSGGQCNTFYGKDATTGAYVEWTAGMGEKTLLFDQPMQRSAFAEAQPLGETSVEDVD